MTRRGAHGGGGGGGGGGEEEEVWLFGVKLKDGSSVKKSASMGSISHSSATNADSPEECLSDGPDHGSAVHRRIRRKKAVPWTEDEHKNFLLGLQMLGKGDWRGISRSYVLSRTPSQIASHAQKHFMHQNNTTRKKRRSSLFDIMPGTVMEVNASQVANTDLSLPSLDLSLRPASTPFQLQLWPPNAYSFKDNGAETSHRQIHRPPPAIQAEPVREMMGISQLTLGDICMEPSALSLRLPGVQ